MHPLSSAANGKWPALRSTGVTYLMDLSMLSRPSMLLPLARWLPNKAGNAKEAEERERGRVRARGKAKHTSFRFRKFDTRSTHVHTHQ